MKRVKSSFRRSPYQAKTRSRLFKIFYPYEQQPVTIDVTGAEFTSSLESFFGEDVAGASFNASLSATIIDSSLYVTGNGFAASLDASFGMSSTGGAFNSTLTSALSEESYLFVTGGLFSSTLSSTIQATEYFDVTGGIFSASLDAGFGTDVTGAGFMATLNAELTGPATLYVAGANFSAVLSSTIQDIGVLDVTGGAFKVEFPYFDVTGASFSAGLSANITNTVNNAVAYVLNIRTGESTRYSNYAFDYIIHVGDKPYGVKSDGLYLLEGSTDNGTAINGMIITKDSDHGAYNSKRLNYVYMDSDTQTMITPYYDSVANKPVTSAFGGRRTKMAMGPSGRYIQLKVANISKLQGMEILTEKLQCRVK